MGDDWGRRGVLALSAGVVSLSGLVSAAETTEPDVHWTFSDPEEFVFSAPTVIDDTVYIGDSEGILYAVDANAGEPFWASTVAKDSVNCAPQVVDGTVYVGAYDDTVYAVDAESGETDWSHTVTSALAQSSPTVVDGTVYIGGYDGLYAIDTETGDSEWTHAGFDSWIWASPTVVDGLVYIGGGNVTLGAFDSDTGHNEWSFTGEYEQTSASPTVDGGIVYTGAGTGEYSSDRSGVVYARDADNGDEVWTFEEPTDWVRSSPTVSDSTVYVGSDDATLYAIDAQTGEAEWTFTTDNSVISSPTVADETVYVGNSDGILYAVDAETGEERWSFDGKHGIFESDPTVVDGTVYATIGTDLYAVDANAQGSSTGSRVQLGTLGHHGDWAERAAASAQDLEVVELAPSELEAFPSEDAFDAEATIVNSSGRTVTGEVELRIGDNVRQEKELTVEPDASRTVRFEDIDTTPFFGEYEYGVFTKGDAATGSLTVTELPGEIEISGVDPVDITVREGEPLEISANFENPSDDDAVDQIEVRVEETVLETTAVHVPGETSRTVVLDDIDTAELEPGSYEYVIVTEGDTATGQLTVDPDEEDSGADDSKPESEEQDDPKDSGADDSKPESEGQDGSEDSGVDDGSEESSVDPSNDDEDEDDPEEEPSDGEIPGFGITPAVTALGAAGYTLKRRLETASDTPE